MFSNKTRKHFVDVFVDHHFERFSCKLDVDESLIVCYMVNTAMIMSKLTVNISVGRRNHGALCSAHCEHKCTTTGCSIVVSRS